MFAAVFRRQTKPDVDFDVFIDGWQAEKGYGVTNRVLNAVNVEDEHDIVTLGFVRMPLKLLPLMMGKGRKTDTEDTDRHDRVADLIAATSLHSQFAIAGELAVADGRAQRIGRHLGSKSGSILGFKRVKTPTSAPDGPPLATLIAHTNGPMDVALASGLVMRIAALGRPVHLLHLQEVDSVDSQLFVAICAAESLDADSGLLVPTGHELEWAGSYEMRTEHDFTRDPVRVPFRGPDSIAPF